MGRWELVSGGSAKFWEVAQAGAVVTVRFGRLGAAGQTQTKELASEAAAAAHVAKLVAEKEKKGYQRTAEPASSAVPAVPAEAPARDEDAWVMPPEWQRKAMCRRDVAPVREFVVDAAQAQRFRERVAERAERIEQCLSHPASEPDLVRALRDQLDGRPDPLGAAVLAGVADSPVSPVHWWIEEFGLPFAALAAVHQPSLSTSAGQLRVYRPQHLHEHSGQARALIEVRTALAAADDATYDAALAGLEKAGGTPFSQVARAFLAPTRQDWFEEANATAIAYWLVHSAASTVQQLRDLRQGGLIWSTIGMYSALRVVGPAVAPVIDAELRAKVEWGSENRKLGLEVLAALPTDEAFLMLLGRLRERYVRPALVSAMAAFPVRAARLMAARAATDADVRDLLRAHVRRHPGLELTAEVAALIEPVPDAPAGALPPVLASPPWTHRRPQPKPVVLRDLPVPAAHLAWLPGEHEEWSETGGWWTGHGQNWVSLAEAVRTGEGNRHGSHNLFAIGPEELARPLLADWTPADTWSSEFWGRRIAARFGMDALPALLRLAASNPHVSGVVLLPYATTEVAGLMADWFVRLKTARAFAVSWLSRHREAAGRLLLPAALGAAGPARRNAEFALRHLHLELGVDVIALATAHGAEAAEAIRTLIDIDPLDVLPAKLPAIGAWADLALLPQVLLADGSGALSAEAARNLLMTAALSKQDAVYPGLPLAVEVCDRASLAEFAWAAFGRWQDVGAPAKDGWVLTALGWFGDDETVRRLAPLIRAWPGESQHARAVAGLDVLAQIGSEVALMNLNSIAERVKFKGLKAKAQEKVSDIAAALGLSRDQLSDRLVPRLGLDDEATLAIDYGPRRFTVGFDEHLKPYVLDEEGKRRKDLPKPGARDDQELAPSEHKRFGQLKKDVRSVASDQIHRLERAMVDQRTWTAEELHTVLAAHPLLWHLVRRLVWITDSGLTFRLAEDRTLANASDDEVTLPAEATVRVAHPVDLAESLESWGEVFADYEILQPFPQLGRPTYAFTPGDTIPQLHKYLDRDIPVGKLLGLTKRGWARCQPQDNGCEPWMTRPLPSGGALVAALDPGITVGMVDLDPEMKVTELWFDPTGQGAWGAPRGGGPATFDVDPVTASELLSELESLHA
ncbi:DUF4132 domain-containing protein [Lentzea sp. BCCO 10_0798]|uniref:DUF4132 domain-containing protein n=1 Tax=Lentzea kristufekii TaxID=3095430 RepID=A0ABU4U1R0_9PSEU|nr:DUF4132 domain-containing protein [Lentzea sp. BCCO 10_0798]MDX8054504.1 DUF4132 domain-containing protein [Lentzea sp. BCCO 10_0798]